MIQVYIAGGMGPAMGEKLVEGLYRRLGLGVALANAAPTRILAGEGGPASLMALMAGMRVLPLHPKDRALLVVPQEVVEEGFGWVFGGAETPGRLAVLSTYHLLQGLEDKAASEDTTVCSRLIRHAAHEVGHTHGLHHCPSSSCLMSFPYSDSYRSIDTNRFCPYCRQRLDDAVRRS